MRNYDRIHATRPAGIEHKRAHIVGGGIAGLAAAAFLATDGHMPGANITIYEAQPVLGGSMDAAGDPRLRYTCRGERELEAWMECLWYLCGKVPSLQTPGLTVLDETHRANEAEPIEARLRLMERQGHRRETTGPLMSAADARRFLRLLATPEEDLQGLTIAEYASPQFSESLYWLCASSMLAFREFHSLVEARRYALRFLMDTAGMPRLNNILHTRYNEYDSIIEPLRVWLSGLGVSFRTSTSVRDIAVDLGRDRIVATGLTFTDDDGSHDLALTADDLVFFTNGSMTQNTTMGDERTVAPLNRSTSDRGVFTVWQRLAALDPRFGNPDVFLSDIDKSNWVSFFTTFTGDRTFFDAMESLSGEPAGTGGATTIVDSAWQLTFLMYGRYFPDQPADVQVMWAYGQCSDVPGDHIRKPMIDCTGAEMLAELLYHCGLTDRTEAILEHARVSTAAMPYITSQFLPRRIGDRPDVVPAGSVNLAFIGQFAELPGDVVFTVETSVRTAMMAVWGLLDLDKPLIGMHEPQYDTRVLLSTLKAVLGIETFDLESLPLLLRVAPSPADMLSMLNRVPNPVI